MTGTSSFDWINIYGLICAGILGLCVGSFATALIHRLPRGLSPLWDDWREEAGSGKEGGDAGEFQEPGDDDGASDGAGDRSSGGASHKSDEGAGDRPGDGAGEERGKPGPSGLGHDRAPSAMSGPSSLQAGLRRRRRLARSRCASCGHILGGRDLVPLLSWLWTRGKCRYCGDKIGAFYPLTELAFAVLFMVLYKAL